MMEEIVMWGLIYYRPKLPISMSAQEMLKKIGNDWQNAPDSVRQEYQKRQQVMIMMMIMSRPSLNDTRRRWLLGIRKLRRWELQRKSQSCRRKFQC